MPILTKLLELYTQTDGKISFLIFGLCAKKVKAVKRDNLKKGFDTNLYTAFKTFSDLFDRLACEDYHTADHILHRIRAR